MGIKRSIKNLIMRYDFTRKIYDTWHDYRFNRSILSKYGNMTRREIFSHIYRNFTWGGGGGTCNYYSGEGSHVDIYVRPYCEIIKNFLSEHPEIKSVIDLGCGDFNVASQFINNNINYIGVDIVPDMIESHKKFFSSEHVNFMCLDIVEDELPDGDLCIIRQVLQHLNNNDIAKILEHCRKYKYIIITEHVTVKSKAKNFNIDIHEGNYNRIPLYSGVYLDEAPFNIELENLAVIPYDSQGRTELITSLIKN